MNAKQLFVTLTLYVAGCAVSSDDTSAIGHAELASQKRAQPAAAAEVRGAGTARAAEVGGQPPDEPGKGLAATRHDQTVRRLSALDAMLAEIPNAEEAREMLREHRKRAAARAVEARKAARERADTP